MTLLETGFAWLGDQLRSQSPRSSVSFTYTKSCREDAISLNGILRDQKHADEFSQSGDTEKARRAQIDVLTNDLIAAGISSIGREAVVAVAGETWAIDLANTVWGNVITRIGLKISEIATHQNMEAHGGPVR